MWEELLTILTNAAITLAAGLVTALTAYAIKWIGVKIKEAEQKLDELDPNYFWALEELAELAVRAAEKLGAREAIQDKFDYAFELMQQFCLTHNIVADTEVLEAAIEAAVLKLFPKEPEPLVTYAGTE